MNTAVRYYSRSGNTKIVAEAFADALQVKAVSVDSSDAQLKGKTDVLFIGGALYAYGLDKHIKTLIRNLDPDKVGKEVIFSTSWISRHSIYLIRRKKKKKGIPAEQETFYVKNKANDAQLKEAADFALKITK